MKYQGWTNQETYAAALVIANTPEFYFILKDKDAEIIKTCLQGVLKPEAHVTDDLKDQVRRIGDFESVNWNEIEKQLNQK